MASNGITLQWEGKRTAKQIVPPPVLHCVEEYGEFQADGWRNRLIQGDNLHGMAALHAEYERKFALIYLDPPFFTGSDFYMTRTQAKQTVHSEVGNDEGEQETVVAYTDKWKGELPTYLQWLYDRLAICHKLLADDGVLYLHLNWQAAHYAKLLLDEIFGAERFQNEIIWCYREAINSKKRWNRKHDTILFYSKGEKFTFNYKTAQQPYAESNIRKYRHRDEKGAYRLMGRGIVDSPLRCKRDLPPEYETLYPGLTYRHYLGGGTLPVDYWMIDIENQASAKRTGYPTQKPEALLERILLASTNEGELIGDFCCGSGTTLAVAQRLGRRWIGCDMGESAIQTTWNRLRSMPEISMQQERILST